MTADDLPPTVPPAVRRAATLWPGEEAVVDGDQRLTWDGLADRTDRVARAPGLDLDKLRLHILLVAVSSVGNSMAAPVVVTRETDDLPAHR